MKNSTNIKGYLPRNFARKYRIKELIYTFPPEERQQKVEELAEAMGIDKSSVRRIWNYRPMDSSEARPSQLRAAAAFFNIPLEAIFSDNQAVVTPISV